MTVIPVDLYGVLSDGFAVEHLDCGLVHLEGAWRLIVGFLRLSAVSPGADGTRAVIAKKREAEAAVKTVFPVDFNTLRL